jgi:glycine/D-amino acid oxidase-like deaminating enzyme
VGDKFVVHNYGHGGSGWSLSWGSSTIAVRKALEAGGGDRDVAVIGCGALGLTSALLLQRAGARATIYAKERAPEVRSSRATGSWTPDSRVALTGSAAPGFAALWEEMARTSFAMYQSYLGMAGNPIEWTDRYSLFDTQEGQVRGTRREPNSIDFARYQDRISDITPKPVDLPPGSHPFPTKYARRNSSMTFNVADYSRQLMTDFLIAGGKIETTGFHAPSELSGLPQKVVINATGYGARALWKDESITPVRGQIAWLIPQPDVNYGLNFGNLNILARRDGIVVQSSEQGEASGWNDENETPDRGEAERAVQALAALYSRMSAPARGRRG